MVEPSRRYFEALELTRNFHATQKTFTGRFLLHYVRELKQVIDELGCKTLLDYGCGKGRQWNEPMEENGPMLADLLGVTSTLYDPGWPAYEKEPTGKFDIVVCTQVLGSIPIADLPWAVDRLHSFATKAVFVGERLGKVKKLIHIHMRKEMPHEWTHDQWAAVLKRPDDLKVYLKTRNGLPDEGTRYEVLQ